MPRSDAPLIKHLVQVHGESCARDWQRPPLVLLAGAELLRYLLSEEGRAIADRGGALERLPWDDVVYELGPLREVLDEPGRGAAWLRVRTLRSHVGALERSAPWMRGPADLLERFRSELDAYLVVEAWEDNAEVPGRPTRGLPLYPDVVLLRRDRAWAAYLYPNPACRGGRVHGAGFCDLARCRHRDLAAPCAGSQVVMGLWSTLVPLLVGYLLQTPDYPIEVTPRTPNAAHAARTARLKPWLRDDLSHVILIDPARVREYGHPSGEPAGAHAPPRPHQRRGHWRRLTAERFGDPRTVWVRPAWVGAVVWEDEGATYRVLSPTT